MLHRIVLSHEWLSLEYVHSVHTKGTTAPVGTLSYLMYVYHVKSLTYYSNDHFFKDRKKIKS